MQQESIRADLKKLIVATLNLDGLTPDRIADDEPLFGAGLGLDSVDALELVVALEKEFGISIASHEVDQPGRFRRAPGGRSPTPEWTVRRPLAAASSSPAWARSAPRAGACLPSGRG